MDMQVDGLLEACVYASDLGAAERFYREVLGLRVHSREAGRHVFFRCGSAMFLVFDPARTLEAGVVIGQVPVPRHGAGGPGHVAFSVAAETLAGWKERLAGFGVPVEAEIDWPGGGRSLYFRDPAGNSVELATPALWQAR